MLNRWRVGIAAVGVWYAVGAAGVGAQVRPTRVILFLGDGVGATHWSAAQVAADALAVARMPVVGLVDTRNVSDEITDSAASATAYAAGVLTYNGAIGVGPDTAAVPTVLELARARGLATGLVATSSVTHATPAAFAAHVRSRTMHAAIARQLAGAGLEVLLGGGRAFFDGRLRRDSLNLVDSLAARGTYVATAEALAQVNLDTVRTLVGLFAPDGMPPAIMARAPDLAEMTRAALSVLDRDPQGFFLMVEGSQPDWRSHENAPLAAVTAEMLDFDRAIGVALEYRERHPETLIVVTADHETAGLALQTDSTGAWVARYTSAGHTAALVPLFAIGPGAERFGGLQRADAIGRHLLAAVRGGAESD